MGYNFRDDNPILGANAQIELLNGASASSLVGMQVMEPLQYFSAGVPSPTSQVLFIVPPAAGVAAGALPLGNYRLLGVSATFTTASTSGTLDLTHETGTTAPGGGTSMLTGTVSLAGTANTVVSGAPATAIALATQVLSPGDRISIKFAGTLTNLVALSVSVYIGRSI